MITLEQRAELAERAAARVCQADNGPNPCERCLQNASAWVNALAPELEEGLASQNADALLAEHGDLAKAMKEVGRQWSEAKAQCGRLAEGLAKYGGHGPVCSWRRYGPCTCGWEQTRATLLQKAEHG